MPSLHSNHKPIQPNNKFDTRVNKAQASKKTNNKFDARVSKARASKNN